MTDYKGLFSHNSDEWTTPTDLYNELDKEFSFNLDPCATPGNAKCEKYFTKEDNGLAKSWGGGAGCFAIRHIAKYQSGQKSVTVRAQKTIL